MSRHRIQHPWLPLIERACTFMAGAVLMGILLIICIQLAS